MSTEVDEKSEKNHTREVYYYFGIGSASCFIFEHPGDVRNY